MEVHLQYGQSGINVEIPSSSARVTVLAPRFMEGLPDEEVSFQNAVRNPVNSAPLKDLISASDRVAVVIQRDGVGAAGVVLDARPPG